MKRISNSSRENTGKIIADRLSDSGWTWGCVAVVNNEGDRIFVVDAHLDDGKRYVVRSDEKLMASLAIEHVTRVSRSANFAAMGPPA